MFFKKLLARAFNKRGTNPDNHVTSLKAGDKAPAIAGILQDGKKFDSNSVKGKKVVLYFYPKDDTAGCTMQACSLRDNYELMQKQGYEIIGVSADSAEKHQDFIKKYSLPFPLIADMDHKLINAYDVWGKKSHIDSFLRIQPQTCQPQAGSRRFERRFTQIPVLIYSFR